MTCKIKGKYLDGNLSQNIFNCLCRSDDQKFIFTKEGVSFILILDCANNREDLLDSTKQIQCSMVFFSPLVVQAEDIQ